MSREVRRGAKKDEEEPVRMERYQEGRRETGQDGEKQGKGCRRTERNAECREAPEGLRRKRGRKPDGII